jgi:mono/diheme cytochrome c family protein
MNKILFGALGVLTLGAIAAAALIQFGSVDFAADVPHSPALYSLIGWAKDRSIESRISNIVPPGDLSDTGRIRRGAGNYNAMCAQCHLSPVVPDSEIRKGLYPQPPNLTLSAGSADVAQSDAGRFWIIKHGIKSSGMAAWGKAGIEDAAIWDLAAFLKVLPNLSPDQYQREVKASGGHSHEGMTGEGSGKSKTHGHNHPHDTKPHARQPIN